MEFGEKTGSRYIVIVCPKCRQHAQITETEETGKKTLRCQHCGALLKTRKLRIFGSFEELPEAVDFRTRLQAEISGKGKETFSLDISPKKSEKPEVSGSEDNVLKKTVKIPELKDSSIVLSAKKDQKSVMSEILKASDGKIRIGEFRERALEKGIDEEKFERLLRILMESGEIYSPEPGVVKLI
ncbi:MAG TPA: hypothetical protein HA306_06605 [Methanosarcina sp.]|nr:hypothetical protein [Methanosarcina sp.]